MRVLALLSIAVLGVHAAPARAQDTLADPIRAERLRQLIETRFGERLKEELGLTEDQASKLRVSLAAIAARRRGMEQTERRTRQALANQLRPGIAANPDSVARLVNALTTHRVEFAQTFADEMKELSTILSPVQRGQYLLMRDRLMQRAQELMQQRDAAAVQPGPLRRRPLRP